MNTYTETATVLDSTVRVDRSIPPTPLDGVKKMLHSELEKDGPGEYDVKKPEEFTASPKSRLDRRVRHSFISCEKEYDQELSRLAGS